MGAVTGVQDAQADGLTIDIEYIDGLVDTISTGEADGYMFYDDPSRVTTSGFTYTSDFMQTNLHNYTYDGTGNRLTWQSMDAVTGVTDRTFAYATDSHRLLSANTIPREYNAVGNTTRVAERTFVYDSAGRMSQAKVNGIVEMNYAYSPFGHQVARYIAGQTTVALHDEEGHWLGDYDGAGRPIRQMVWMDGLPLAALDGDAIRDIQTDHLGTPRVVIDRATNTSIWAWNIGREAFGSDAPNEDPDKDGAKYVFDMRFPGQRYDAVTRLFQNGWRDYDPTSGRYIQSDPIGLAGGISTYAYVGSNPHGHTDPFGLDIAVVIDRDVVKIGYGYAGHSAVLIGNESEGWTYYSKNGLDEATGMQSDSRSSYAGLGDFLAANSRYKEGFSISTNKIQDFDARRWADAHINDPYSGAWNNCADFVHGALYSAGLDVSGSLFPSTPNGIRDRIDFRDGEISSAPINVPWYPEKYKPPKLLRK
jgi:RHS repeat-associated protein